MEYCILKNSTASCSICNESHQLFTTIEPFKNHVFSRHTEIYNIISTDDNWLWKFFYISENGVLICSICKRICVPIPELTSIRNHLLIDHYINNRKAKRLRSWVRLFVTELSPQRRQCRICNNVYDESNSYNFMLHLTFIHLVDVPRGIEISEE